MKYLFPAVGMAMLAMLATGCGGGSTEEDSHLLVTREEAGNRDIYLFSPTGVPLQRLTTDPLSDEAPRWSPDRSRVAFIRNDTAGGTRSLYVMNADGSNQQNLYPGVLTVADPPYYPSWLNNDTVIFRRGVGGSAPLAKRSISGGEVTNVTSPGPTNFDDVPAVSLDGTKIVFVRASTSTDLDNVLCIANADGTNIQPVVTGAGRSIPSWSPDGTKLAFIGIADGDMEVHVANADGSNPQKLTDNTVFDYAPVWSPDSSKLLFATNRDGNHELYQMNADGSGQVRLTNTENAIEIPYGWR